MEYEISEIRQAIVIADSYNENFQPFTGTTPLALLPIVNVPMIEYTLENLNQHGIEEVIIFCCKKTDQIKRFVHQRQQEQCSWSINMTITFISSVTCRCIGEAMRDVEARRMIRGNVLLLGVDSLTNINVRDLLEAHKRQMKRDRGTVMTVVYKESHPRIRSGNEVVIAIEPKTKRLLFHQRVLSKDRKIQVPARVFTGNREVNVRRDIIDPQIAVCSNAALPLFADNFDFQTRDDFLEGVLVNEEILNSRIYVTMAGDKDYGLRINNWQSYHFASLDVINRWTYPLVPDMCIGNLSKQYEYSNNNAYIHVKATVTRSSVVDDNVVIGDRSDVKDSTIELSVIGPHCRVGRNCNITHSFVMEGTDIGDGCVLDHCIIGKFVKLGDGCHIGPGTVLGERVEIPAGKSIKGLLLQANPPEDEWGGDSDKIFERAYTVPIEEEESDDDSDAPEMPEDPNPPVTIAPLPLHNQSDTSMDSDVEEQVKPPSPILDDANIFFSEVLESLLRGYTEKTNAEYLILEVNSSRYAYNMALCEVNYYVVKAMLQIMLQQDGVAKNTVGMLRRLLAYFGLVFRNYIRNKTAMMDCLKAIEDTCETSDTIRAKIPQLVHYLYEQELLEEDVIIKWYDEIEDETIKSTLDELVGWLKESSDEDDD
ncbi:translation initiation factor eIF-2B subunit epsilon [Anopheles nili]|uniref:translation initiation factor eIF-2B subunit epsilon n=1 Tax=Anopheles nili TaxID=185578 RepID=UPI00237B1FA9|nr:translation initiation factor eIF-2B subunit epsilon [Anopheles nili]